MSSGLRHHCMSTVRLVFLGVDFPVGLPGSPLVVVVVAVVRFTSVRCGLVFGVVSRVSGGSSGLRVGLTNVMSELEFELAFELVSVSAIDVFELVFVIASNVGSGVGAISN